MWSKEARTWGRAQGSETWTLRGLDGEARAVVTAGERHLAGARPERLPLCALDVHLQHLAGAQLAAPLDVSLQRVDARRRRQNAKIVGRMWP